MLVAVLAVGNGGGRIVAGMLSDKIGRKATLFICFVVQAVLIMLLSQRQGRNVPGQRGACWRCISALIGANYGANLALFPSVTKDYYGLKNFGVNYGLVFTAWGLGGFMLSLLAGTVYDASHRTDFTFAYYCSAVLLVAAALVTFVVKPPHHEEPVPEDMPARLAQDTQIRPVCRCISQIGIRASCASFDPGPPLSAGVDIDDKGTPCTQGPRPSSWSAPTGSGKTPLGEMLARGACGAAGAPFRLRVATAIGRRWFELRGRAVGGTAAGHPRRAPAGRLLEDVHFPVAPAGDPPGLPGAVPATAPTWIVLNGLPRHVAQARSVEAILPVTAARTGLRRPGRWPADCRQCRRRPAGRVDDDAAAIERRLAMYQQRTARWWSTTGVSGRRIVTLAVTSDSTAADVYDLIEPKAPPC